MLQLYITIKKMSQHSRIGVMNPKMVSEFCKFLDLRVVKPLKHFGQSFLIKLIKSSGRAWEFEGDKLLSILLQGKQNLPHIFRIGNFSFRF